MSFNKTLKRKKLIHPYSNYSELNTKYETKTEIIGLIYKMNFWHVCFMHCLTTVTLNYSFYFFNNNKAETYITSWILPFFPLRWEKQNKTIRSEIPSIQYSVYSLWMLPMYLVHKFSTLITLLSSSRSHSINSIF